MVLPKIKRLIFNLKEVNSAMKRVLKAIKEDVATRLTCPANYGDGYGDAGYGDASYGEGPAG